MIRFDRIQKTYTSGCNALKNISFSISNNEMVFLTGHSGAGKSTLLRLIAALEKPNKGQLIVNDQNITQIAKKNIPKLRQKIGLIFQDHRLLNDRCIAENVALPLIIRNYKTNEINKRVRAALDKVDLIKKANLLPSMLSAGEQQRVGIARAIVNKPLILLADEPTGNLDPQLSKEIFLLFKRLNELGVCVFVASHDLNLVKAMKQRVIVLNHGELMDDIPASIIGQGSSTTH